MAGLPPEGLLLPAPERAPVREARPARAAGPPVGQARAERAAALRTARRRYLAIVRKTIADVLPKVVCYRLLSPDDDLSADLLAQSDYQEQEKVDEATSGIDVICVHMHYIHRER